MAKLKRNLFTSSISKVLGPKPGPKPPIDNTTAPQQDSYERKSPLECQRESRFIQLPEDILFVIMDHLNKREKANVIKACRYLHQLLEVTLYKTLGPPETWPYYNTDLLHRTLVQRPDLIPHIRSYRSLLLPTPHVPPPSQPPPKRTLLDRILHRKRAEPISPVSQPITETEAFENAVFLFTRATNIVDLDFIDWPDWTSNPTFQPIKAAVSKMQLTRLAIWWCAEPVPILREQPELRHLEIGWDVHSLDGLERTDIPKLASLTATLRAASYIVPGRPIEHFHLVTEYFEGDGFNEGLFKSLALSTKTIIAFSMFLHNPWEAERVRIILQILTRNLPDIEELILTVAGTICGRVLVDEIPSFTSLRRLAFLNADLATATEQEFPSMEESADPSKGAEVAQQPGVIDSWTDLFSSLKRLCPSLVDVERTPLRFFCTPGPD